MKATNTQHSPALGASELIALTVGGAFAVYVYVKSRRIIMPSVAGLVIGTSTYGIAHAIERLAGRS